jgi:DNA-binding transcriptional LysR family regulator
MQMVAKRGVPHAEHIVQPGARALADWEGARVFLAVIRHGSFRAAAPHLRQSFNVIRRRIEEFEETLGLKLMTRHVDGVRLTTEGEKVLAMVQKMEAASLDIIRTCDKTDSGQSGEVRIAVTEGLGTFWIGPRLVEHQRAHPNLMIDLSCGMGSADVLRMEADLAIQLTRPETPDLKVAKLGRLHLMYFASKSYVQLFGMPETARDIINHRMIIQSSDNVKWREFYDRHFPGIPGPGFISLRTNVSSATYWAIAKGGGIGLLPTYAQAIGADLIPLNLDIRESLDVWLTYHPDAQHIPRVRHLIDWVIQAFSPQKFPWFRDEFIHPNQFATIYRGEPLVNMFAGFTVNQDSPMALSVTDRRLRSSHH